jgi:hypothetical protein
METSDNKYIDNMIKNWKEEKSNIRKKLPIIYKTSNEEIKTIIKMLVETEYISAIKQDNEIRRNANNRNEKTTMDKNADNYKNENEEIMKMIGVL